MVTKPSRLRCACAGASAKSCLMPMKMPKAIPSRPMDTLMRNSDLVMVFPVEICLSRSVGSVAGEITGHARFVVPIDVAEFLLEITLLAPDHGKVQQHTAWNDQKRYPVEIEDQRDPAQCNGYPDIERVACVPEHTIRDEPRGRQRRVDVGPAFDQRAPSG